MVKLSNAIMNSNQFNEILDKYVKGICSEEEKILIEDWYARINEQKPREMLTDEHYSAVQDRLWYRLGPIVKPKRTVLQRYSYLSAAAVILLVGSIVLALYTTQQPVGKQLTAGAIVPGSNKAVLILANGKKINLSNMPNGEISQDASILVSKKNEGEVQFLGSNIAKNDVVDTRNNTISIPKGGQWKLVLQDGTKVWLNAATSLTFPSTFTGAKREIYLDGEAYLEVAKDKYHPFIVHSGKQAIEVLGTHFNVNAYSEEPMIRTTLLEGSVRINGGTMLKPGQQAINDNGSIKVGEADTEMAVAWKQGNFIFNGEDLASIMRKVSRWYNVDVQFQSESLKAITFTGSISRSVSIKTLLRRLSLTKEVNFKTSGQLITVQPYTLTVN